MTFGEPNSAASSSARVQAAAHASCSSTCAKPWAKPWRPKIAQVSPCASGPGSSRGRPVRPSGARVPGPRRQLVDGHRIEAPVADAVVDASEQGDGRGRRPGWWRRRRRRGGPNCRGKRRRERAADVLVGHGDTLPSGPGGRRVRVQSGVRPCPDRRCGVVSSVPPGALIGGSREAAGAVAAAGEPPSLSGMARVRSDGTAGGGGEGARATGPGREAEAVAGEAGRLAADGAAGGGGPRARLCSCFRRRSWPNAGRSWRRPSRGCRSGTGGRTRPCRCPRR
jgi:hypothetical protein